jgi:hypothetical protein
MSRFNILFSLFPLIMVAATAAEAGTLANAGWLPSNCGSAPVAVKLDLSNLDAYNHSVGGVNNYRKSSRTYVDCLIQEANSDIQAITKAAKSAQQAALDADNKILEDEKEAEKKFPK